MKKKFMRINKIPTYFLLPYLPNKDAYIVLGSPVVSKWIFKKKNTCRLGIYNICIAIDQFQSAGSWRIYTAVKKVLADWVSIIFVLL